MLPLVTSARVSGTQVCTLGGQSAHDNFRAATALRLRLAWLCSRSLVLVMCASSVAHT
jgi:hypothetical protein